MKLLTENYLTHCEAFGGGYYTGKEVKLSAAPYQNLYLANNAQIKKGSDPLCYVRVIPLVKRAGPARYS